VSAVLQRSASDVARDTIRLLAQRRLPPTPEHYSRLYAELSGGSAASAAGAAAANGPAWTEILRDLLRHWEARQAGWTQARKRESLERLLASSGSDPSRLASRLKSLLRSWAASPLSTDGPLAIAADGDAPRASHSALVGSLLPAGAATLRTPTPTASTPPPQGLAPGIGPRASSETDRSWRSLTGLIDQLLASTAAELGADDAALADRLETLRSALKARLGPDELSAQCSALGSLLAEVDVLRARRTECVDGLLSILRLILENIENLVPNGSWVSGQMARVSRLISERIDPATLREAERSLRVLVEEQRALKVELEASAVAVREMFATLLDQLATMDDDAGGMETRLESYAGDVRKAASIQELSGLIAAMLQDAQAARERTGRARAALQRSRDRAIAHETRVRELEVKLRETSDLLREDPLTRVLNRRGLDEAFTVELARNARSGGPLCVAMLDIDNFKAINDTHGHSIGDRVLQYLAEAIGESTRPTDVVGRYGGEEFVVLLPETSIEQAVETMTRLQRHLTQRFFLHNNERLLVTFSAGVARVEEGETSEDALARADAALYDSKRSGKNRVSLARTRKEA